MNEVMSSDRDYEAVPRYISAYKRDATRYVRRLQQSPDFLDYCREMGIATDGTIEHNPKYWGAFAQFAANQADAALVNSKDPLRQVFRLLAAATPDLIFAQTTLNRAKHGYPTTYNDRRFAKERSIWWSGIVKDVAYRYPGLSASDLTGYLASIADKTVGQRPYNYDDIKRQVVGVQREMVMAQLLEAGDRQIWWSDIEENIQGIDIVATDDIVQDRAIWIDVKPIKHRLRGRTEPTDKFLISDDGIIILPLPVPDDELADRMLLPGELVDLYAPKVEGALVEAALRMSGLTIAGSSSV